MKIFYPLLITAMFGNFFSGKAQSQDSSNVCTDRQPCVAGQFYPKDAKELGEALKLYFAQAIPRRSDRLKAIVSPHAGYVFSGQVAAHSFNQIDPNNVYETIFLIGSSHRVYFDGASIYNCGNYITPLGTVKVDQKLANLLIHDNAVFEFRENAHLTEHSLEVQLPFLQYHLKTDFKVVPIIIATQAINTINEIAKALKPWFNEKNLFIISSDFSHYPSYEIANEIDHGTAQAISSNSPEIFLNALADNESKALPGLSTSMCGWTSMLTILNITKDMADIKITPLFYQNSGDVIYGDHNRVVGYWAISVSQPEAKNIIFTLTNADKRALLEIARKSIKAYVLHESVFETDIGKLAPVLKEHVGAFVSLHTKGELRGCIGKFNPDKSLYRVVEDMAISAAGKDYRFGPVLADELPEIEIEISVLTPMQKINSIDEIELGRHGIYISQGYNSGTFLPQVAESAGWNREEFLGHCARDKARIGWDGWKTADIYTYEAIVFDESDFK